MWTEQRRRYEYEIAQLKEENRELKKIAADAENYMRENQLLHSENQMAARIQNSMLPMKGLLDDREHFQVYGDIDFAKEVGGDYYDYFTVDDGRVCLLVGDVSGKGVPAVIYMVAAKLLIKSELQSGRSLSETYEKVNRELFCLAGEKQFVTSFSVILNTRTGEAEYVNAGHTPALLIHGDETVTYLKQLSGLPLGSYYSPKKASLMKYQSHRFVFKAGDLMVIYTDGCTEASDDQGRLLGIDSFTELFQRCSDMEDIGDKVRYVQRQIISFENHEEQDDDYTIVAIEWKNQ